MKFPRAAWNLAPFISPSFLKIFLANTMSSINSTVSQMPQFCSSMETYKWRDEYLGPAVHRNLIVTSVTNGFSFPSKVPS